MKKSVALWIVLLGLAGVMVAQSYSNWEALGTLRNARFVYVTSYDGSEFSRNVLSEDRAAISRVQGAVRSWGYIVVNRSQQADMILVVQSRGSDDTLAVYSTGFSNYLWRSSQKYGFSLERGSLLNDLKSDLDRAKNGR